MKRCLLVLAACGGSPAATSRPAPPVAPPAPAPAPAASPAAPLGHPRTDLIPRSVLFGNPERAAVQLSPDGKYLSWVAPRDGVMNVYVAPLDHLDQARPITAEHERPVYRYRWTFDSQHVTYFQDHGGDENFHLYRADLDGKTTDLTPYKDTRVNPVAASERHPGSMVVTMNDRDPKAMDAYAIELGTGHRTLLYKDTDGISDYVVDQDLRLALARKPNPDGSVQLLRYSGKAWQPFDTIPFEDSESTEILGIAGGGKVAYAIDSRGRDTSALVEINLATKKQRVLRDNPKSDAGDVLMHPTTHRPRAVSFDAGREQWVAVEKALEDDLDGLRKLPEAGNFRVTSMTLDDHLWIVSSSSPQHPAHYYLWDHKKHEAKFLFAAQPELDKQPLVPMETVTIPARDGLQLVSYVTRPAGATGPVPMVLWVHGGPWGRDTWGYDQFAQLFANRGYAVLQVNYRASAGFGKAFLNAGNQQWGNKIHDDLIDGVAWAVKQGITTKDQVAIAGISYGGYSTLAGLAFTPDVFRCGIDVSGPANLLTLMATIPPYWTPGIAQFKKRIGDWDTPEGKALLVAGSPLTKVADIKKPLLIAQGANDPRVKNAEPEQIVAAMKQHHLPVTYIKFPDEGHYFGRPQNEVAFWAAAEAFLSVYLGGSYEPVTPAELSASSMKIVEGEVPGFAR
jgi:dipeptidyl aminopeptidase/acylaminoacyl peptidase